MKFKQLLAVSLFFTLILCSNARYAIGADYLKEMSISQLQKKMAAGDITSQEVIKYYINRINSIDKSGPTLNSVIEINPDALEIAKKLDKERLKSGARSMLHGIPILLKDNIDTADKMHTAAGSLALMTSRPAKDAAVVTKLRKAGAIILGKANMSEWASFRSSKPVSGWSGRGGQTKNPYILDRTPSGSSSGSAVAVSANLTMVALGTETNGSLVSPASVSGVVAIKPTSGLTSRVGVIPISKSQDSVGIIARNVEDAVIVFGIIAGIDPLDDSLAGHIHKTTGAANAKVHSDYTRFLDADSLKGMRVGVDRSFFGHNKAADEIMEDAIEVMKSKGAIIIESAPIHNEATMYETHSLIAVLLYEFKDGLNNYLKNRKPHSNTVHAPLTLEAIINFNNNNHDKERIADFDQEMFTLAQSQQLPKMKGITNRAITTDLYKKALENNRRRGGKNGIDAVMKKHKLDVIVAVTGFPAGVIVKDLGSVSSTPSALAGYPLITVPAGFNKGLPVGITFMGGAFSESDLIRAAYAFEEATKVRKSPKYLKTLDESAQ